MGDDEIALKLMRLYKELRSAYDPAVRQSVCNAIDALVAQLKPAPHGDPRPSDAAARAAAAGDD